LILEGQDAILTVNPGLSYDVYQIDPMKESSTERLYEQVARKIAHHAIRERHGVLPIEADLCRDLSVSRTVLREAIKMLSAKGMVEVSPKRGTNIQPREKWNLLDPDILEWHAECRTDDEAFVRSLCEVRQFLEPAAAELAAERATADEVKQLYWHLDEMATNVDIAEKFIAADLKFHAIIFSSTRNDLLQYIADAIGGALRASRSITVLRPGSSAASLPLHRSVADAIRDRDPVSARAAMIYLVRSAARDIYHVRLSSLEKR
jgi:GntR family transcriptional regulator, galactonate operon transcriptional repressor